MLVRWAMHLRTTYLIRCVSQPLGAIVKGLALANEVVEHLEWKTNFISWKKKSQPLRQKCGNLGQTPVIMKARFSVYLLTPISQGNLPVNRPPYLVIIFHSSVCPSVSQLLGQGNFIEEPYQECSEKCFQIIALGLDL